MASDGTCQIVHRTVADLNIVSIEKLAVFIKSWKVLVNESYNFSADVCFHVDTKWGIEPYDFSVTISTC